MTKTTQTSLRQATLKAQDMSVEFITFSGGGAKGAAYSGVYAALTEGGIMQNVRAVAGASAGAITAAMIATGITPQEFEKISKETNLQDLLGKQGAMMVNKDGTPLYELVQNTARVNIATYLNSHDILEVGTKRIENIRGEQKKVAEQLAPYLEYQAAIEGRLAKLKAEARDQVGQDLQNSMEQIKLSEQQRFEALSGINNLEERSLYLQNQIKEVENLVKNNGAGFEELRNRANSGGKIYFKDLGSLNIINLERFKDLVMTAVRRDNGELTVFSPHTTPDIEIALAARASASIPLVFQPVRINDIEYVDGGYRDNTPTTHFKTRPGEQGVEDITDNPEKTKKAKQKNRALVFAFGSNKSDDPLHVAIYSQKEKIYNPNKIIKFLTDVVFKMLAKVGGKFQYSASEEQNYQKVRDNALNAIMVDTKNVSTLSFDEAQRQADYLHIKGHLQTMGHMHNHELGTNIDKDVQHKEFMLEIYEKADKTAGSFWGKVINAGKTVKPEILLEFCKPQRWYETDKERAIEKFIVTAAVDYVGRKLNNETNIMSDLIKSLNDPKTPDAIKRDYAKVLNVKIASGQDIGKLQFKKEDFKTVLDRNQSYIEIQKPGRSQSSPAKKFDQSRGVSR